MKTPLSGCKMGINFAAACLFCLVGGELSSALGQTFLIDTNQSSITISGTALNSPLMPQAPGSLTASIAGTLQATITGSTIQFVGQSTIQPNNSGSWQPKADGTAGSDPANYGATATTALGNGVAALRNVLLDVISDSIPVSNGEFDSSSLTFFFPSNATSSFAYNISGFFGQHGALALTGYATNKVTTLGTLTGSAGQQTITIPVNATFVFSLLTTGDTPITLKGQLVAVQSAQVPPFKVESFVVQNQTITLQWQGSPGEQFKIISTSDFITWQTNVINATFSNGTYTWTSQANSAAQFLWLVK